MNKLLLIIICLFASCLVAKSQQSEAENLYKKAEYYKDIAAYDSSIFFAEEALKLSQGQNKTYVQSLNLLGFFYALYGNFELSDSLLDISYNLTFENKELEEQYADYLANRGTRFYVAGSYNVALNFAKKALRLRQKLYQTAHPNIAKTLNNMGIIYDNKGHYDSARFIYEENLAINQALYTPPHPEIANTLNNIGMNLFSVGNLREAEQYLNEALQMYKEVYDENHPEVAAIYFNLGTLAHQKRLLNEALQYTLKAKDIYEKHYPPTNYNILSAYLNLGGIYGDLEDHETSLFFLEKGIENFKVNYGADHPQLGHLYQNSAILNSYMQKYTVSNDYLKKALEIYQKSYGEESAEVANSFNSLGSNYNDQGIYDSAKLYFKRSIALKTKVFGAKSPALCNPYLNLSNTLFNLDKYDSSLYFNQKGIINNSYDFNDESIFKSPKADDYVVLPSQIELLNHKSKFLHLKYYLTQDDQYFNLAYQNIQIIDTLFDQTRNVLWNTDDQLLLARELKKATTLAQNLASSKYEETGDQKWLETFFYYSEKGKAMVLSKALAAINAKKYAGISDSLLYYEDSLSTSLVNVQHQISQLISETKMEEAVQELQRLKSIEFSLNLKYQELIKMIEKKYPKYYQLKHSDNMVTLNQLFEEYINKDKKSLLLSYSYYSTDSVMYIGIYHPDHSAIINIPISNEIDRLIRGYRNAITFQFDEFRNISQQLSSYLIDPVLEILNKKKINIEEIVIIPDGLLHYMPFESLLPASLDGKYLIEQFRIRYINSATIGYEKFKEQANTGKEAYIAFAPVFDEHEDTNWYVATSLRNLKGNFYRGNQIVPLPGTEEEVVQISKVFKKRNLFNKYFLFKEAKESNLKSSDLQNFRFIHIATHGFVNDEFPELSGLLLMKDSLNEDEDGILYSGEIFSLPLNADLVTLSACETGLGKIVAGEGVIGLTRAFLYAGAKSTLVSLWPVSDNSTSELMIAFYNKLLSKNSRSASLQDAKLKLIKSSKYSNPFYWAPFVLIGY